MWKLVAVQAGDIIIGRIRVGLVGKKELRNNMWRRRKCMGLRFGGGPPIADH
jgi:hypothetical protein